MYIYILLYRGDRAKISGTNNAIKKLKISIDIYKLGQKLINTAINAPSSNNTPLVKQCIDIVDADKVWLIRHIQKLYAVCTIITMYI